MFAENFAELGGNVVMCNVNEEILAKRVAAVNAKGSSCGMDYSTSKAGLMYGLTKSIAQFGEKYGIRCVCLSPGPVLTGADMANMKTLLGRAAEPQKIVDLCLFIASDKGQFIYGENIIDRWWQKCHAERTI